MIAGTGKHKEENKNKKCKTLSMTLLK